MEIFFDPKKQEKKLLAKDKFVSIDTHYGDEFTRQEQPVEMVNLTNSFYTVNDLEEILANPDTISDSHLLEILRHNLRTILVEVFNDNGSTYVNLFRNKRFLDSVIYTVSSMEVDTQLVTYCSRVAYHYISAGGNDQAIVDRLISLTKILNQRPIMYLASLGVPEMVSIRAIMCKYSDSEDEVCIKRLNKVLQGFGPKVCTVQVIVYLYEVLFDNLTSLFEYSMFDTFCLMTDDGIEVYKNISEALLQVLNYQPDTIIYGVINSFSQDYLFRKAPNTRFDLTEISHKYLNVINVCRFVFNKVANDPNKIY